MSEARCVACGETVVVERVAPVTVDRGNRKVMVREDRHMFCPACGTVSYRGEQIAAHEFAVANAIREEDGLLSAEELCLVRSKYRLKQTDMEQILSTGPKTWTRWERGKVPQSKATDKFIRAIAEDPYLARRLMRAAGVENAEAEEVFAQIERDDRKVAQARLWAELRAGKVEDAERVARLATDEAFEALHAARGPHQAGLAA